MTAADPEFLADEDLASVFRVAPAPRPKRRLGTLGDGGYVIVDGYHYDLFLSAGVGSNTDFERDFIRENWHLSEDAAFMFDGTISGVPNVAGVKYIGRNIGFGEGEESLSKYLCFGNNIFLKMDIEGAEWEWLACSDLKSIQQMVIEFHGVGQNVFCGWVRQKEIFRRILETHDLVHAHGNNNCDVIDLPASMSWGAKFPAVLELTFLRKPEVCGLVSATMPPLDYPNCTWLADIPLSYPFY